MSESLPPILVIDDEKNMRLSLETVLRAEGYDVRLSESAEAALKAITAEEFFLVVTDGRLGGMSGYELLRDSIDYACFHDVDYVPQRADYRDPQRGWVHLASKGAEVTLDPRGFSITPSRSCPLVAATTTGATSTRGGSGSGAGSTFGCTGATAGVGFGGSSARAVVITSRI